MASLRDESKGCLDGWERWLMRLKTRHATLRKTDSRSLVRGAKRKIQRGKFAIRFPFRVLNGW